MNYLLFDLKRRGSLFILKISMTLEEAMKRKDRKNDRK